MPPVNDRLEHQRPLSVVPGWASFSDGGDGRHRLAAVIESLRAGAVGVLRTAAPRAMESVAMASKVSRYLMLVACDQTTIHCPSRCS
jgi:hypothetical protein